MLNIALELSFDYPLFPNTDACNEFIPDVVELFTLFILLVAPTP